MSFTVSPAVEQITGFPVRATSSRRGLDDVQVHLENGGDRDLVKRGGRAQHALFSDDRGQFFEIASVETRRKKTRNVLEILPFPAIRVNEGIQVPELELEYAPYSLLVNHPAGFADDPFAVVEASLVIVGQVQDKEVGEIDFAFFHVTLRRGL
jgi:hypothetical protein